MGRHKITFEHAFSGIWYSLKTQSCFSVHLPAAVLAVGFGFYLQISRLEWLMIIFAIILVLTSEMMNTAIESLTDLITADYRIQAKIAKDVSAGMVFISALGSVIVALLVFLPKCLERLNLLN